MTQRPYITRADGWVAGRRVRAGETIALTPAAARYEPVDPAPAPKQEKSPRRVTPSKVPAPDGPAAATPALEAGA